MKKAIVLSVFTAIALAGCSSTLPIQSGGIIEKHAGKKVSSTQSVYNFLGFNPLSLESSEKAIAELQSQCGGSDVTGVTALYRRSFAFFGSKDAIQVTGYCAE